MDKFHTGKFNSTFVLSKLAVTFRTFGSLEICSCALWLVRRPDHLLENSGIPRRRSLKTYTACVHIHCMRSCDFITFQVFHLGAEWIVQICHSLVIQNKPGLSFIHLTLCQSFTVETLWHRWDRPTFSCQLFEWNSYRGSNWHIVVNEQNSRFSSPAISLFSQLSMSFDSAPLQHAGGLQSLLDCVRWNLTDTKEIPNGPHMFGSQYPNTRN